MAAGKKPTKADKSNVKKRTVTKKPSEAAKKTPARGLLKEMTKKPSEAAKKAPAKKTTAMRTPAKKTAVEKASSKRTPARGLLKETTKKTLAKSGRKVEAPTKKIGSKMMSAKMSAGQKKMPAKKATSLKKGNKKEALTKKISSKMNSAKVAAGQGKKIKKTPFKKAVSGKKTEALTKKIPSKMNSLKATSGQKKETKKTAGMKNPVIVIKSVDVSPSSSEKEKKVPKEVEEKEMSVEVSSGEQTSADDAAASQKSQKNTVDDNSGSASSSMASSSSSMDMPTSFDLATFVESRLGAINSPSVAQELSGSEKSTLADLINHNMRLAHNLYEVEEETILETALVSLLPDFEVEEIPEISSVAKAAHREVVQFRDLLLLQKVETISEAQRTGWNLAAPNLSDAAQVALLVNLLGLAMKLTGLKPMDSVSQAPGGKVLTYNREEVEAYLAIFDSVTDEMAEGWKEGGTNLPVKRRMLADLNTIIQNF